ncbi:interferon-induced protein with tetratricopeptide repeats 3 [Ochotona princeps]|uniref:interferon-induced protein with tetratricopeptide repeats 3 n=1 Tax=Ochotona princeps TaxID=9978 RepID=UPI0027145F45|nr:interferon-induced protein with tetratricopeptide repeats 3 [Ochotona princeps]XP_058527515.1 interferon-induced protein with tetratricopeptide repeats 3 [Ochotona princeps]
MSEVTETSLEKILPQLECHFTWNLFKTQRAPCDLEERVCNQIEILSTERKATMYNLLAYIKHLKGQNEAALECLEQAEQFIQQEQNGQADVKSLVTWGNYAWVHYHMGQLSEAQMYIDKVRHTCEKLANPYRIECPELYGEEGWTHLKCGRNERAKVYFEKALAENPSHPEFSSGLAIALYNLDNNPSKQSSVSVLQQAVELNPDNQYLKVILGQALRKIKKEAEGEQLVEEALQKAPCQTDVLRNAARFYRQKGDWDKNIELLQRALECTPNNGYLYYQIANYYKAKIKQMQNAGKPGDIEKIEELRRYYLNKANEKGLKPFDAESNFSEFLEEEEDDYGTAFKKDFPDAEREAPNQSSPHLQLHHKRSEDTTAQHYLEDLPTGKKSSENEELKHPIKNGNENLSPQNAAHSYYLRGLIHKQDGNLAQAAECFEKGLCHLLRNTASGIGDFFLSASGPEGGNEEMGQATGSSIPKELQDD